jgi:prephenate dehydrogenase
MAGSEQAGVAGSDALMFAGSTWVLTPGPATDPDSYSLVHRVVSDLGADVVVLDPEEHDRVVAVVSHVPHLTAVTLMRMASARSATHASVMRLAAGGFRDMTRVAAGHPAIWPDICVENRDAICDALDELMAELAVIRHSVASSDRQALMTSLAAARAARINLPTAAPVPASIAELRISVPDRPGVLAEVTAIASEASVNIYDIEIAHSAEGPRGVLILVVDATQGAGLTGALEQAGYRVSGREFS